MTKTVVGSFDSTGDARTVLNELTLQGFDRSDIDVIDQAHAGSDAEETFFGMGIPSRDAHYYAENVRRGGATVIVKTDDSHAQLADDIMHRNRVVDIESRTQQWRQSGWTGYEERARSTARQTGDREAVIPVVEEELKVGKREVEHGGVRVYSRTVEKPVREEVRLREEHVNVERRPVDRPATEADLKASKDQTVELRETSEEPVVQKSARVVEEVEVGKDVRQRTESVEDTVRRTEVDVDKDPDKTRRH